MKNLAVATACAALCLSATAAPLFDVQIRLLTEKAELCIRSADKGSKFCQDFNEYQQYLTKDSTEVWINYHIDHGDVNGRNGPRVLRALELTKQALAIETRGRGDTSYFVQAGAYARADDAEQQRAKLAMLEMDAQVTEVDQQTGQTIYRVRVGPFDNKAHADAAKGKLAAAGIDSAVVGVPRETRKGRE